MHNNKRRDRFVKLANKRVNRTLNDIRLIGNLSTSSNYSYTAEDAEKIVTTLKAALERMQERFDNSELEPDDEFKL
jgi:hypothetical protein